MTFLFPVSEIDSIKDSKELKFISKKPMVTLKLQGDQYIVNNGEMPVYSGKLNDSDNPFYYKLDETVEKDNEFIKKYGYLMKVIENVNDREAPVRIFQPKREHNE